MKLKEVAKRPSEWKTAKTAPMLTLVLVSAGLAQIPDPEDLKRGIVHVHVQRDRGEDGTGFVVSSSDTTIVVLTASHVVEDARSIDVFFYSDPTTAVPARALKKNAELDVALLEVRRGPNLNLEKTFPQFRYRDSALRQLEQVASVDGNWAVVTNTISLLSHDGDEQWFEYTSGSTGNGFSGGPVFDTFGNIIGMHDKTAGQGARAAVAVRIGPVLEALAKLGYQVPRAPAMQAADIVNAARAGNLPKSAGSGTQAGIATAQAQASSDLELYQKAMSSRDPASMEDAATKISNPTLAASLRTQAQMLRSAGRAGVPDSRKRLQIETMKVEAKGYARRGNYTKALPLYQQLAEGGDSEAMASLGYLYYNGQGVEKNYLEADKWFEKAAAAGETSVMGTLGVMYAFGEGVQRNDATAVEWDRKAAAAGNSTGMLGLGFMYENGRGVPKNLGTAVEWYRKAAASGDSTARDNLRRLGAPQ